MNEELTELREWLDGKFAGVDEKFARVDEKFARVDERFVGIDEKFAGLDEKFAGLDEKSAGVDEKFAGMQQQIRELGNDLRGEIRKVGNESVAATVELREYLDEGLQHLRGDMKILIEAEDDKVVRLFDGLAGKLDDLKATTERNHTDVVTRLDRLEARG